MTVHITVFGALAALGGAVVLYGLVYLAFALLALWRWGR